MQYGTAEALRLRRASLGTRKRGARTHMANNPKKVKDPTEVALSAIQEALNISDSTADTSRSAPRDEMAPPIPSATPAYNETTFNEPSFEAREPRASRMDMPTF